MENKAEIRIEEYTAERIQDVLEFERELRRQEGNTYFWEIDEAYINHIKDSFADTGFNETAVSLLAYKGGHVIGRIDASLIKSRFDGTLYEAYLNWICVLKNQRHNGVAQLLMKTLKEYLKELKVETLIALTAENEEAARFYDAVEDKEIYRGISIKI